MDILNWLHIKKQQLIRTTLDSPQDLLVLGADVSFQKRGDKYQSYAIPANDFIALVRPYKSYTALVTQSEDIMDTTVMENTIGEIEWVYNSIGDWSITSANLFTTGKTVVFITQSTASESTPLPLQTYTYLIAEDRIVIETYDGNGRSDTILNGTSIEIRVYN
jgi:hypothetical protein